MKTIKTICCMLLSCATVSLSQTVNAQNFYKWVDAQGSTHYTTTPPPKNAKKKGNVDTYGWRNSNPTNAAPATQEAAKAVEQATQAATPAPESIAPPVAPSVGTAVAAPIESETPPAILSDTPK